MLFSTPQASSALNSASFSTFNRYTHSDQTRALYVHWHFQEMLSEFEQILNRHHNDDHGSIITSKSAYALQNTITIHLKSNNQRLRNSEAVDTLSSIPDQPQPEP
jgi:lipopolysaccharide biosynthesis protein